MPLIENKMKNKLRALLLTAVVLIGISANAFTQIKTGGYKKIPASDAGAVAAAEYAAKTQAEKDNAEITLQTVKTAESQTVAGVNYKLCIEVYRVDEGDDVEIKQFVQTVVFRSLKKEYQLKSWEEAESCGEEE